MMNYDLIVIGAGPGGYVAAIRAAQEGMRVALAESRDVGGTCLNRGCIPTKTLMHCSHLYHELCTAEKFGISARDASFDIEKMYARKDEVTGQLRGGVEALLKANKIDLIRGKAMVEGAGKVRVETADGTLSLTAANILLASGSVPARPPIPGLELPGVITSDELLEQAGTAYDKLVIIGGGVIGAEFATVFRALGTEVTIIEAMDRILPTMDREISQNLSMILKKRGIAIHTASMVKQIAAHPDGLECRFEAKGNEQSVTASAVLVCIGRKANLEGIFAEGFSVQTNRGVVVNEQFMTSVPGVYAIGDLVDGGIQLAHVASAQGEAAVAHMLGKEPEINLSVVPSCIYTDPEIASVGITADEAKAKGIAVKTGKYSMSGNGKSIIEAQERGFIKLVYDADSEKLLGAQLMCARATDLISELASGIANGLTVHQMASVIRPHPTFTEGVSEAVESVLGKAVHIMPKK